MIRKSIGVPNWSVFCSFTNKIQQQTDEDLFFTHMRLLFFLLTLIITDWYTMLTILDIIVVALIQQILSVLKN